MPFKRLSEGAYVLLPGDRIWFFTYRNDGPPARKLLPFAGYKILQTINGVNGL